MRTLSRPILAAVLLTAAPALAQEKLPPPTGDAPAVPANAVAATVNGQPVLEVAVQRGLKRWPAEEHAKARPEILDFLIDNLLIDQYLIKNKLDVDAKEVDARLAEIKAEIKKHGQDAEKFFQGLQLTEAELKAQVTADLRWDKYAIAQSPDKLIKELFDQNPDMFDGSLVRARHILLTPASADPKAHEAAKAQLAQLKKEIEEAAAAAVAKLPPTADALAKEQERTKATEAAFAKAAVEKSACPSGKKDGGDLNWFPRAGSMVEPFAKAAFALKPYQMSDVVMTPFGYHLILTTARKPGNPVKFEDVKEEVREVFCVQLRERLVAHLRQSAQIQIAPVKP